MVTGDKILIMDDEIIVPNENSEEVTKRLEEHFKEVLECMEESEDDIWEAIESV